MTGGNVCRFRAFGLLFEAPKRFVTYLDRGDIESVASALHEQSDVKIQTGPVARGGPYRYMRARRWSIESGRFVLEIDDIAKYEVREGSQIVIDPADGSSVEDICLFLFGSVLGALFHQRQLLPLHASAVEIGGECAVFLGPSGAGKSTLAAALGKRGYRIVTDDIAVVSINEGGVPWLMPGLPQVKLCADAARELGENRGELNRLFPEKEKLRIPLAEREVSRRSLPIRCMYELVADLRTGPGFEPMEGQRKLSVLIENTYRISYLADLESKARHFRLCSELTDVAPLKSLVRQPSETSVGEVADLLEKEWRAWQRSR